MSTRTETEINGHRLHTVQPATAAETASTSLVELSPADAKPGSASGKLIMSRRVIRLGNSKTGIYLHYILHLLAWTWAALLYCQQMMAWGMEFKGSGKDKQWFIGSSLLACVPTTRRMVRVPNLGHK